MAQSYGASPSPGEIEQVMTLLGGQPHLTQLACYHLTRSNGMDFAGLELEAANPHGPFGSHLRALEKRLQDAGLLDAMKQLALKGSQPNRDVYYRLHGAGLVREEEGRIVACNQLYARFFGGLK